ncbi:tetratricopeptide repeat protein 1 [Triplophysa dalaica]|uniref:tetratricopeptide repeat protein 1 n=1 Tax=Triplophysa dalaica TaxID=1582913 RepID=UPI0024E0138D|nr:tetratricopeptide repeat protein 1 [Triplophysa dalaica]
MERESDSETLSATMSNTLKVSETRGSTADQEEDRFYDCDDTLPEEDTSTAGQTNVQCNETAQSDRLESHAGIEKDNDSDRLGNTYSINQSCLSTTSAENTLDSSDTDSGLKEQNNEDQEKSERFVDDDEMRDGDSDSEFKEAASSDKVTEFDEEYLRELEKDLTDEEKESRRKESLELKEKGNTQFKSGEHVEAEESYTAALQVCPVHYGKERSILFSNRAAARLHQDKKEAAISDCSKAIELNSNYVRAILRRAELYEKTDKLDEALEDYKTVLEKDPGIPAAREACMRLPRQIEERNEKLKEEMMSKLKDLGNMILRPFGLSTNNFQVNQDSNSGSYSVNFVQNPNNNNR